MVGDKKKAKSGASKVITVTGCVEEMVGWLIVETERCVFLVEYALYNCTSTLAKHLPLNPQHHNTTAVGLVQRVHKAAAAEEEEDNKKKWKTKT